MTRKRRRTAGERRGRGRASTSPASRHESISQRNCARPAAVTAQASATPLTGRTKTSAAMRKMLSSAGVAAVAAKRSTELSMPPRNETSEMKTR